MAASARFRPNRLALEGERISHAIIGLITKGEASENLLKRMYFSCIIETLKELFIVPNRTILNNQRGSRDY